MRSHFRVVLGILAGISVVMIIVRGFQVGGEVVLNIGLYFPLLGACVGAVLLLFSINVPMREQEKGEPWLKRERLSWALIGCGCLAWAIGESLWRRYLALGEDPFPSLADIGYASFPLFVFAGLILQPSSKTEQRRIFLLLDSLISMGALLSIAWFLLLGPLAQRPEEALFTKMLSFYYPTMDTAVFSCSIFLLLRGTGGVYQSPARRISLFVVISGLALFATSDFLFNLQQNLDIYDDGTWVDLGWPLGIMALGAGAYLRRFLPAASENVSTSKLQQKGEVYRFKPALLLPYLLVGVLFCVLVFNVLSSDSTQQSIRPVLVIATMIVVGLVIVRQIITMLDNTILLQRQNATLSELEKLNLSITDRNTALEAGITHLKEIQARLANGEVRARASNLNGELWPLAVGLNRMADRMMRIESSQVQAQKLSKAIDDFIQALVRARSGGQFVPPMSCFDFPEMQRLIMALGLKSVSGVPHPQQGSPRLRNERVERTENN